jgi:hypothetical protein
MIARLGYLGDRSDRRVWLCSACFTRFDEHNLRPDELLALARLASSRAGNCEWCAAQKPALQVRVPGADGRIFAFNLCEECARRAHDHAGGQVLHGQAARTDEVTTDPRYERAREVAKRRKQLRRVK